MKLPIFIADAFTARAFRGNPAAVCLLENELDEDMHQKIAREMNLSETAFIRKLHPTDNFAQSSCFGLRWFTPASEVPLCGHATLASAAVLFHKIKNMNSTLTFVTLSGELRARQADDGIVLDLPLYPVYPQDFHEVEDLIKTAIGNTLVQDICYSPDTRKLLLRLSDTYNRKTFPLVLPRLPAELFELAAPWPVYRICVGLHMLFSAATGPSSWGRKKCMHFSVPNEEESWEFHFVQMEGLTLEEVQLLF
ncbi:PREDICTED: phenazine biosynthesis-like domain-containing protein isoform X5 [Rhinopithecus bieti]|uniref:phenazine biosynthesis-like domain-containing protein isoform X5 n=1 Tax=Rhinopithecus bieti TaxID=61621 RepID=UPI00083C6F20|nr:PREDICTED: phenazine biosynthesis-like domain-containing protein isoform X5 [Rhinopithecus bieti]